MPPSPATLAAWGAIAGSLIHGLVDSFFWLPWVPVAYAFAAAVIVAPASRPGRRLTARGWPLLAGLAAIGYLGVLGWLDASWLTQTRAVIAANQGRPAEAFDLLRGLAALDPGYPQTAPQLGVLARQIDPANPDLARRSAAWLEAGLRDLGEEATYRTWLASAWLAAGEPDRAAAAIAPVVERGQPGAPEALAAARIFLALGDRASAERAAILAAIDRPSLLASPRLAELPVDWAAVARQAGAGAGDPVRQAQVAAFGGNPAGAAAIYESPRSTRPEVAPFGLGCLAIDRGDPVAAAEFFATAIRAAPAEPYPVAALGRARIAAGDLAAGRRLLRRAAWLLEVANEPAGAAIVRADLAWLDGGPAAGAAGGATTSVALVSTITDRLTVPRDLPPDPLLERPGDRPLPLVWRVAGDGLERIPIACFN